jgi:hypothetical protein
MRKMLWLIAVGAACADAIYDSLHDDDASWASYYCKRLALRALADLGDQRAIDILGGER